MKINSTLLAGFGVFCMVIALFIPITSPIPLTLLDALSTPFSSWYIQIIAFGLIPGILVTLISTVLKDIPFLSSKWIRFLIASSSLVSVFFLIWLLEGKGIGFYIWSTGSILVFMSSFFSNSISKK